MSNPVAVSDIWDVIVGCSLNGQSGLNKTHWQVLTLTGAGFGDADLASTFDALFAPLYKALMTNSASYYGIKVVRHSPMATFVPFVSHSHTGGGTGGANAAPLAVCGLLKFNTNRIGKTGRGRNYIPFPDVSMMNSNSEPSAGYQTSLENLALAMEGPLTVTSSSGSGTIEQVIVGKAASSFPFPVTIWTPETVWGTQHRRGDFGKLNVLPPISP